MEHSSRTPPKAVVHDYDSDDSDDLSPRTVQLMQAAYANMMGGSSNFADMEVQASADRASSAMEGKEGEAALPSANSCSFSK